MNSATETIAMSHKLTPARQNEILSHSNWTPEGRVHVQCTHRTDPLLRLAGIKKPMPMEFYDVEVRRDRSGFLVVDLEPESRRPAVAASMGEMFQPGGLFYGLEGNPDDILSPEEAAGVTAAFIARMRATRHFEVRVSPTEKLVIAVMGFEDAAVPAPCEPEQWVPARPENSAIYAAARSLAMMRQLEQAEIHPEPQETHNSSAA